MKQNLHKHPHRPFYVVHYDVTTDVYGVTNPNGMTVTHIPHETFKAYFQPTILSEGYTSATEVWTDVIIYTKP